MERLRKTDTYVCVDLETTGLNPKTDKIIEIGAVRVERGRVTGMFESLVNPLRPLAGERILLGHSVLFDYSFLKKAAVDQGVAFERAGIDTLRIARRYQAGLESRSLDFLCGHYGIAHRAHRALEDAKAACALYDKLWEEFGNEEDAEKVFAPRELRFQVKKEAPATEAQKKRLYKLLERHKLITDYDLNGLTKNEASRYTDLIFAKYGR